jgi:hypothetical protein
LLNKALHKASLKASLKTSLKMLLKAWFKEASLKVSLRAQRCVKAMHQSVSLKACCRKRGAEIVAQSDTL